MVPGRARPLSPWALASTLLALYLVLGPLCAPASAVRWLRQTSGTTQHLADITYASAHYGWACGRSGTIVHTDSNGARWTRQYTGTTKALTSLSFVDYKRGWAAGFDGTMLRTIDSGQTWTRQSTGTTADFRSAKFLDAWVGLVAGGDESGGVILRTADGGANWIQSTLTATGTINAVAYSTGSTAFAVGESGIIYRSTNGGRSWSPYVSTGKQLATVAFVNSRRGWVGGQDGTILATTDYGETWEPQSSGSPGTILRIRFVDANNGWATTSGPGYYTGSVLRTGNGGNTWTKAYDTHMPMPGAAAYEYDEAWMAGWNGTIIRFLDYDMDSSTKWIARSTNAAASVTAIDFIDGARGWAVTNSGTIYRSANGGVTWQAQVPMSAAPLRDVKFRTSRLGWAVGDDGLIMRTEDGSTWRTQSAVGSGSSKYSLSLAGAGSLWTAGAPTTDTAPAGNILRSVDDGASWPAVTAPFSHVLRAADFTSGDNGWLVGDGGMILHTSDGSAADPTWDTTRPAGTWPNLSAVTFTSSANGIVLGQDGMLLRTTNGGLSWQRPSVPTGRHLSAIASFGADVWAVGERGTILHSADSGATWRRQTSGTYQWLTSVRTLGKDLVWASGGDGVILTGSLPLSLSRPALSTSSVRRRISFVVRSYLSPQHTAGITSVQFQLFHLEGRRWVLRKTVSPLNTNDGSRTLCSARTSVGMTGYWRVRARHLADRHPELYTAMASLKVPR